MIGKDRTTGAEVSGGFSNWEFNVDAEVISGQTRLPVVRTYVGLGSLIDVDDIALVSDLSIQTVRIKLSQTNASVNNMIRGYDARNAKVEIHYGLLDLDTRKLVARPLPHFVGIVNKAPVTRPKTGSSGGVALECVSRTRELTIINPAKKSDETQKLRSGDRLRQYSGVAGSWSIYWGEKKQDQ
ncbi:hypothetical protein EOA32_00960 [Mesorhizobium sp. M1A.F.Ca.ET.072.01.1.1]|nr:hypothetical protein EOA32_00960 [Mesorhizobium sp. M1A.F.Ca.ET.072.01.1.1]